MTRERIEGGQYPAANGNLYLQDPHFADMLVTAHKLGFTLVEYEQTQEQRESCTAENRTERINCRERAQEENLLSAITHDGEIKKTVVFVGFNHANLCAKDTEFGQERRLAHLLAKRHPGQVLSTTQTTAFAPSEEVESGHPRIFHKAAEDGEHCQNFEVIHSEPEQQYGRDSWLFTLAGREPVYVDLPDSLKDKEIIIRAHHKGADIDSKYPETPFDQFVFKGARATLALKPEGDYTLSALLGETFVPLGQVSNGHYMPAL